MSVFPKLICFWSFSPVRFSISSTFTCLFSLSSVFFFLSIDSYLFAQTFTQEAKGYNIFVQNNFTFGGGDVEGGVAVGNNLTIQQNQGQFATHSAGTYTMSGMASPTGLLVANQIILNGGGVNLLSGAKISIGNTQDIQAISQENGATANTRIVSSSGNYGSTPNISLNHSQSESVFNANPIDFTSAFTTFRNRAANVSALTTNVTITNANGNQLDPAHISNNSQVYIQSLSTGANILNLTKANLNKITSITFNAQPSANSYLVINIDGPGTLNWSNFNFAGVGSSHAPYILLNFFNATQVNINNSSSVYATIFAPNAGVDKKNSANIGGQVIATDFTMTQGGAVQYNHFLADDPSELPAFPVEWLDLSAVQQGHHALLEWSTATEINNHLFEIERSVDNRIFEGIGQVKAVGNSQSISSYSFTDLNMMATASPKLYYRIKQLDIDGAFSYSKVLTLKVEEVNEWVWNVYPNPSSSIIYVDWSPNEQIQFVKLVSSMGIVVKSIKVADAVYQVSFDVSQLEPGTYYVVTGKDKRVVARPVIVR